MLNSVNHQNPISHFSNLSSKTTSSKQGFAQTLLNDNNEEHKEEGHMPEVNRPDPNRSHIDRILFQGLQVRSRLTDEVLNSPSAMQVNVGTDDDPVMAIINSHGYVRINGESVQVDLLQDNPDIPSSAIHTLRYTWQLLQYVPDHSYVHNDTDDDSSVVGISDSHDQLQSLMNNFAIMHEDTQNAAHLQYLENALRNMVIDIFDNVVQRQHWRTVDAEQMLQERATAQNQANLFIDTFLKNLSEHGADESFNIAWSLVE